MNNSFSILGISEPILTALEKMGFESPTEVQKKAIPHVLQQKDVIVVSKTGTGKTAVFGVPMLLIKGIKKGDQVAILLMNCLEWLPIYFGILKAGAIAVPLNFLFTKQSYFY
jgi:acyl-CoA synthetase (AMP-forming)/AMP-acid ligase II